MRRAMVGDLYPEKSTVVDPSQQTENLLHIAAVAHLVGLGVEAVSDVRMMTNASDLLCYSARESE